MKKLPFIALVVCIGFVSFSGYAEEADGRGESAEESGTFSVQTKLGFAASIGSGYIAPDITFLYSPGVLSFGGGVKSFIGTKLADVYLTPYGTVEFGWFYANLGATFQVKEPDDSTTVEPSSDMIPLYASLGVYPKIDMGPGALVFGTNADLVVTSFPKIEEDNVLGEIIVNVLGAGFNLLKFEAGVGYRLQY